MYSWIWRHLPGNSAVRSVETLELVVVALLFLVVLPWAGPDPTCRSAT